MNAPHVRLRIDRLVLHGVPREQRDALVAALQRELAQQLSQPDNFAGLRPRHAATLRGNLPALRPDTTSAQLGTSTARAIVKAVGS
jgi:hypothetical protein